MNVSLRKFKVTPEERDDRNESSLPSEMIVAFNKMIGKPKKRKASNIKFNGYQDMIVQQKEAL